MDAIGFPFSYTFAAYKIDEMSQWHTNNLAAGNVNCIVAANKKAKLPKRYKVILNEMKDGAYAAMIKAYSEKDAVNIPKWKKMGFKVVSFSDAEPATFREVGGKSVWDGWVHETRAEVPNPQQQLDLVMKTAKDAAKSFGRAKRALKEPGRS